MYNLQQTWGKDEGHSTHMCITFFNDGWGAVFVTWLRPKDRDRPTDHHVRYLMRPSLKDLQDKTETIYCIYSEKLSREQTFANFKVLWLFTKVFSSKSWGVTLFGSTSEQSTKVFPMKIFQFTEFFFCVSFPLYGSTQ